MRVLPYMVNKVKRLLDLFENDDAGDRGIGPRTTVLETVVIPLN